VFNDDQDGHNYAGQIRDGYACGLGVATNFDGDKEYAEHGPDGKCDGRCLGRTSDRITYYYLFERGEPKEHALVFADGEHVVVNLNITTRTSGFGAAPAWCMWGPAWCMWGFWFRV
jgi:hypothetical protein